MGNPAKQNEQSLKGVGSYVTETPMLFVVRRKDDVILGRYSDMTTVVDAFDDIESRHGITEDNVYLVKGIVYKDRASRKAKPLNRGSNIRETTLSKAPSYKAGDIIPPYGEALSEYSLTEAHNGA